MSSLNKIVNPNTVNTGSRNLYYTRDPTQERDLGIVGGRGERKKERHSKFGSVDVKGVVLRMQHLYCLHLESIDNK